MTEIFNCLMGQKNSFLVGAFMVLLEGANTLKLTMTGLLLK
jgi:hypothetical protein